MGTPDFAVASLERILSAGLNVAGVITAPDKPAGRGKKIRPPAVKEYAMQHGLVLLQPASLKDPAFVELLAGLSPDLQVVVAFRMLPEMVWRIPRLGTFNLHASLLPHYRGAAPIHHAIMNGETVTGVTTFMIDEKIDTGNILLREKTEIGPEETAGELHDRLKLMGADLVLDTICGLAKGDLEPQPQERFIESGTSLKTAPKIQQEDCRIDWERDGPEIHHMIRGLSPSPGAFTTLAGNDGKKIRVKLLRSSFDPSGHHAVPGTFLTDGKNDLRILVNNGILVVGSLQMEGRRAMETGEFLRGFSPSDYQPRFF